MIFRLELKKTTKLWICLSSVSTTINNFGDKLEGLYLYLDQVRRHKRVFQSQDLAIAFDNPRFHHLSTWLGIKVECKNMKV